MNNNYGYLPALQIHDGYTTGTQYADQAKLNGRELSNAEKLDRLNPFSESGYMNEEDYRRRYNPDGTLRETGERPQGVLDGAMQSTQGVLNNMGNLTGMPAYLSGGSGVGGQPNAAAQQPVQPNTHEMPDGTVMEGATHEDYLQSNSAPANPVLESQDDLVINKGKGIADTVRNGVLSSIGQSVEKNDPRGTGTNNRRDETETAEELKAKRDAKERRNEMLIRVGGAIAGGAQRGGLAAMQAGGQEYGALKDYNRKRDDANAAEKYAADSKLRAAQSKNDADRFGSPADIYAAQELSGKIRDLRAALSDGNNNAVGASKNPIFNAIGSSFGTDEASIRLRLQELVVDKTLSNTAFTKGAISDREMALFRSDIPQFTADESVWLDWLEAYERATRNLEHNLRTGYAPYKEQNAGRSPSESSDLEGVLSKYE